MIRFFPVAIASVDEALGAQSPALFDAARSLGLWPAGAWGRVVLPTAWPAAIAGLLAAFIAVIKELPATLILSPFDFRALSTEIWGLTEDAYFAAAAPSGLLLLALAFVGLWLGPARQRILR